ncbi:MAG: hypothetical protein EOS73_03780 [Mesorhizobium sp.]|nr:MAG: hypothetical protein EOS73_03780 [Mesorhizobium sp.]
MVRRNKPKQLSSGELEQFMKAAEALHHSITQPLISPQCDHYRSLQDLHEALLKAVREVTGRDATFIRWNGTGPVAKAT